MAAGAVLEGRDGTDASTRFFPNSLTGPLDSFETFGAVFPLIVRHLPTRQCLALATDRFGARATPLLREWREVWRAAVGDVDDYAARIGLPPPGPEAPGEAPAYPDWPGPSFVRPASYHVIEDAMLLVEAVRLHAPFVARIGHAASNRYFVRKPGVRRLADHHEGALSGSVHATAYASPYRSFQTSDAATPYWSLDAFVRRAGRDMAVATSPDHLLDILLDMSAQGHAKAFVKGLASKSGTWVVDIPVGADRAPVRDALGGSMGLFKGGPRRNVRGPGYLVQAMVPFVREHRFFVVSHRVVASTASDRTLSLLDARPDRILDERVARLDVPASAAGYYDRGESRRETDRTLVARMAWGARDLARALRASGKGLDCYVIDMGETHDGRVLPIEINGMPRAGCYGAPVTRILAALRRRADRSVPPVATAVPVPARGRVREDAIGRAASRATRATLAGPVRNAYFRDFLDFKRQRWAERRRKERREGPFGYAFLGRGRPDPVDDGPWEEGPSERKMEALVAPGGPWRRRWVNFLATCVHADCAATAWRLGGAFVDGRLHLHKYVLASGKPVSGELRAPGWAHRWVSDGFDGHDPKAAHWGIGITVSAEDVDWDLTLPCHSRFETVVSLVQGTTAKVGWINRPDGTVGTVGRDIGPDLPMGPESVRPVQSEPLLADIDIPSLVADVLANDTRILDRTEKAPEPVSLDIDALHECYLEDLQMRILDDIEMSTRPSTEAERAQDDVDWVLGGIRCVRADAMGRLLLKVEPDGSLRHCPSVGYGRALTGRHVVAEIGDIDVRAMASLGLGKRYDLRYKTPVVLRDGARTWEHAGCPGAWSGDPDVRPTPADEAAPDRSQPG